jgi:hypothetical protein
VSRLMISACAASTLLALSACEQSPAPDANKDAPASTFKWRAEPAMISNAGVYRDREFVWQDYLYDDRGANTDGRDRFDAPLGTPGPDPADPVNPRMSPAPLINWAGDFVYASPDGAYIPNVADFIEFRVAEDKDAVHYRFRMGDMTAPDSAVVAMCVDEDDSLASGVETWPLGANHTEQLGCERLYTIWGTGGQVVDKDGATQDLADLGATVGADVDEALLYLSVPKRYADPARARWRYYVAAGVWDAATGAWQAPTPVPQQGGAPVATGGNPLAPNIYDLLSNNHEPNSTWNEEKQANDLTAHRLLEHYLDVDFARLAEARDDPDPERTGVVVRIYHSQHPMAQGRGTVVDGTNAIYAGPWVPYTAVIPGNYYEDDTREFAFDFCMHPLGANHNVEVFYAEAFARRDYDPVVTGVYPSTGYLGFTQITSLIDRQQLVYACVLGRGEGVGYTVDAEGIGDGLVDALEVQDDMRARYRIDAERVTVHGVSLGAIGSWYVSRLYPDRYAAVMPYIFTSDLGSGGISETPTLKNLYNLPVYYSIGTLDQFGQGASGDPMADQLEEHGNEYLFLHYLLRQHEGRIEQDFLPFVAQLAYTRSRVKDPARVRYVFEPGMFPAKAPGEGGAYWVGDMVLRDAAAESAEVDVTSLARADQLPKHQVVLRGLYTNPAKLHNAEIRGLFRLTRAEFDALWHPEAWEPGWEGVPLITETELPEVAVANAFTLTAVNLGSVTLDAGRMKLRSNAAYTVVTDGPLEIRFTDGRRLSLPEAGTFEGSL